MRWNMHERSEPVVVDYLQGVVTLSAIDGDSVVGIKADGTILGIAHWDTYKLLSNETVKPKHKISEAGDLNSDGSIDSTDFTLLKRYILRTITDLPVDDVLYAADLNGDDSIDSTDVTLMKRFILKKIDAFPI